jgi:hypothetical protein
MTGVCSGSGKVPNCSFRKRYYGKGGKVLGEARMDTCLRARQDSSVVHVCSVDCLSLERIYS